VWPEDAKMRWSEVEKRIEREWGEIKDLVLSPKKKSNAGAREQYEDVDVFAAILRIIWLNHPIRTSRSDSPGVNPIHTRLHRWAEYGCLRTMFAKYLEGASRAELRAWKERFWAPSTPATEVRRHLHWFMTMREELAIHLENAEIDVPSAVPDIRPGKSRRPRRGSGVGDICAV
jgi:hypothetical protein